MNDDGLVETCNQSLFARVESIDDTPKLSLSTNDDLVDYVRGAVLAVCSPVQSVTFATSIWHAPLHLLYVSGSGEVGVSVEQKVY